VAPELPPITTKPTIPPQPTNKIVETSTDPTFKPKFPPRVTTSNKNNVYHLATNESKGIDSEVSTNDINEMETSKQTILNRTTTDGDSTNNIVVFTIVPIVLIFGVVPIVVASIWLVRRRTRVKKRPTKEMVRHFPKWLNDGLIFNFDLPEEGICCYDEQFDDHEWRRSFSCCPSTVDQTSSVKSI
jgi:hypothetical protein